MLPWLPKTGKYVGNLNEKLWDFFQMRLEFLVDPGIMSIFPGCIYQM